MIPHFSQVGIIGAGAMGRGIAQLAVQAGSNVKLFDTQSSASAAAQTAVFSQWDKLQDKGRLEPAQVASYKSRLHCVASLAELASYCPPMPFWPATRLRCRSQHWGLGSSGRSGWRAFTSLILCR